MVVSISIDPGNIRSFSRATSTTGLQLVHIFEREFNLLGPTLVVKLKADTPIGATGNLSASTTYDILSDVSAQAVTTTLRIKQAEFSSPPPQALVVTQMYRPYVVKGINVKRIPPSTAFIGWAFIKLGIPINELKQVTWLIARSIKRVGTRSNPYPLTTVRRSMDDIDQTANRIGRRIILQINDFDSLSP